MLCNSWLGTVYDLAKDLVSAISYHERHRELAMKQDNAKEALKADAALVQVYMRYAHHREAVGSFEESVSYFEKCLDVSKSLTTTALDRSPRLSSFIYLLMVNHSYVSSLYTYNRLPREQEMLHQKARRVIA